MVLGGLVLKWGRRYLYAMLLRPEYLSQKLDRPLPTKDGGTLRTIQEACDYMTSIGKKRELRHHWQRACNRGVRCCPSSCLSPADPPFSDVFHYPRLQWRCNHPVV